MAGDTDFIALYQELGLDSGCTLEALKQAYRKRVGILHPDRNTQTDRSDHGLQSLNAMYASAMEFHRRHGRLPGATQPLGVGSLPDPANFRGAPDPASTAVAKGRSNSGLALAVIALALVGLWIAALLAPGDGATPGASSPPLLEPARTRADLQRTALAIELGTSAQQVREIHGEPVSGWEQRWEYGPSWIAFHCGVVVDWYSSPLRPLKVASEHPAATTAWSPPKRCKD